MTKDILLSISGLHYDMTGIPDEPGAEEENGPIEVITPASYYYKNGKHYIVYDEVLKGCREPSRRRSALQTARW